MTRQARYGASNDEVAGMSRTSTAPVGVFDSGVGGLTILHELLRELPDERFLYFGDTGNCPYGVRSVEDIQRLAVNATRFLIDRGAKLIVVACNTASVTALQTLRDTFEIPFVGVVPAVKPAAERTRAGRIGVVATEASARGDYLRRLIRQFAGGAQVFARGCPQLVTLAEEGKLDGPEAEEAVRACVTPLLNEGIDQLVLGCTHFPAMRSVFERVAGPTVALIDSGAPVARQTRRVLERTGQLASLTGMPRAEPRAPRPDDEFWCSGDVNRFERTATMILGHLIHARQAYAAPGYPVTTVS